MLQGAEHVIATTSLEKDIIAGNYSVQAEKISIVPCGVNTELFQPISLNPTHKKVARNRRTILFVGRFEENKGLEVHGLKLHLT